MQPSSGLHFYMLLKDHSSNHQTRRLIQLE